MGSLPILDMSRPLARGSPDVAQHLAAHTVLVASAAGHHTGRRGDDHHSETVEHLGDVVSCRGRSGDSGRLTRSMPWIAALPEPRYFS